MVGRPRKFPNSRHVLMVSAVLLALPLSAGGSFHINTVPSAHAQGGNAAVLANLRGQIRRYGCHLPQYASSVAGCRTLHARVNALESGASDPGATRKPYSSPARYTSSGYSSRRTPRPRPPQSSQGGGLFGSLFGGGSYRGGNSSRYNSGHSPYQGLGGWSNTYPSYMRGGGRYRTLCVRTCDGYYWPVSFSTTRSGISRDANRCQSSCQVPTKLFYHRNPGADVQHMVDLQGKAYSSMENAYRYREEYVPDCRCKPEPWSEAAKETYEQRAEMAKDPEALNQLANTDNENGQAIKSYGGSTYQASNIPRDYYPVPEPRLPARSRYIAEDPAIEGRWWAGSW